MLNLHDYQPYTQAKPTELAPVLPLIMQHAPGQLRQQLIAYGLADDDVEAACYKLYEQHGIDPLLQVHPLRESFFQMELSEGNFQDFVEPAQTQQTATPQKAKPNAQTHSSDYIRIPKDGILIFMAIALTFLLLLQLIPKP